MVAHCPGLPVLRYPPAAHPPGVCHTARILHRHAGAGGETQAWDTKDFTLSTSLDGTTWTPMAQTKNNVRPVTIHSFAPTKAAKIRLDIQTPQSDPATVAARVDELEAYAR